MNDFQIKPVNYHDSQAEIQAIRIEVFQQEQGVDPALEFDGQDLNSQQFLAYLNEQPVGTARIRFLSPKVAKIERLAVLAKVRGQGIGKRLTEVAIEFAQEKQAREIVINSQEYVKELYQKLGFVQEGGIFDEAGIPHVKMKLNLE